MTATVHCEIPFHDIDSLGIVWHGHYYKYFEIARTALYRSLNLDIGDVGRLGFTFPVIESQCRHSGALSYGQQVEVTARLRAWEYYTHGTPVFGFHRTHLNADGCVENASCSAAGAAHPRLALHANAHTLKTENRHAAGIHSDRVPDM